MKELKMRKHMKERFSGNDNISYYPPLPQSLNIEINNTCNYKCEFCPFHGPYANKHVSPAKMSYEVLTRLLETAYNTGIGHKELGLYMSGEPFLHERLIDAVSYAKKIGFKYVFLTTNGSLATSDNIERILNAGIDSIRFSVNAADSETYKIVHGQDRFNEVYENIKNTYTYVQEHNLNTSISLSCVLTQRTIESKKKIEDIFGQYVDDILFIPVLIYDFKCTESVKQKMQVIDDSEATINPNIICPMLFNSMYIDANLNVIPCCEYVGSNVSLYNLRDNFDLLSAWNSMHYKKYRGIFLEGLDDTGTLCKNCYLRKKGINRISMEKSFFE